MRSEINNIFNRLKTVGNPQFLIGLLNSINKLFKNRIEYPMDNNTNKIYFRIDNEYFKIDNLKVESINILPKACPFFSLSKTSIFAILELLDITGEDYLNDLLIQLKRIKNIRRYKEIIKIIQSDFKTNMTVLEFTKIIVNQL